MIKRYVLITCFFLTLIGSATCSFSQCEDWKKVLRYKNVIFQESSFDNYGNVYFTLNYFNPASIEGIPLPSRDYVHSNMLVKMDKDFSLLWIKDLNGVFCTDLAIDLLGNILLSGAFYGPTLSLGSVTFEGGEDYSQGILLKLNADGVPLWGLQSYGSKEEYFYHIALTSTNDIVVGGIFSGEIQIQDFSIPSYGGHDVLVLSITEDGIPTSVFHFGVPNTIGYNGIDYLDDIIVDSNDDILISGVFGSSSIIIDSHVLSPLGNSTWFIAKIDQSGHMKWVELLDASNKAGQSDIAVDNNDNVYFTGDFSGVVEFDHLTLTSFGESDVFLVKYDVNGNVMDAKNFGGSQRDVSQYLITDLYGNIVIGGYTQSPNSKFGDKLLTGITESDVFIGTLDSNLNVLCLKSTQGSAFKNLWELSCSNMNYMLAVIEGHMGITSYDGKFQYQEEEGMNTLMVLAHGDCVNQSSNPDINVDLGADVTICHGESIRLKTDPQEDALYNWSNGVIANQQTIDMPGEYWVEVSVCSDVVRDTIVVSLKAESINFSLGDDRIICSGESVVLSATQLTNANYLWNTGAVQSEQNVTESGIYSVTVWNECSSMSDQIEISVISALPEISLGEDKVICAAEKLELVVYPLLMDANYKWSTGSVTPSITINEPGIYTVEVSNQCNYQTAEINVVQYSSDETFIPNVITVDENNKNDFFVLPEELLGCQISVFDRWGSEVYKNNYYENDWGGITLSPGVYYYILKSRCASEIKGIIHLLKN